MKIICVGRNYEEHARELKNEVPPEPVLFLKPDTALLPKKMPFFIPDFSQDVHFEAELVVRINKVGKNIKERFAHKYYNELSVGIDFTARDLQQKLKEKGLPWEKAKAFDGAAAVGKMLKLKEVENPSNPGFSLELNGKIVQKGKASEMIFGIDKLISYISEFFTLKIGDLIFTGTPAGVGKISHGDHIKLYLGEMEVLNLNVK